LVGFCEKLGEKLRPWSWIIWCKNCRSLQLHFCCRHCGSCLREFNTVGFESYWSGWNHATEQLLCSL